VGYPIILQVISNLDEKYSSIGILALFNSEPIKKYYLYSLYISLIFVVYSLKIPPFSYLMEIEIISILFNNTSSLLLFVSTSTLVVTFILLINKVIIYYRPINLTQYLINKHKDNISDNDYKYFEAISDVFLYSIKNFNNNIINTIAEFLYSDFKEQRRKKEYLIEGYPEIYYKLIYSTSLELLAKYDSRMSFLHYRINGGKFLLGEMENGKIHETTYNYLWSIQIQSITKKNDDVLMYFWQNAHSHIIYCLQNISPVNSEDYKTIINEKEISLRKEERNRFLEFLYVLGAIILNEGRYNCLKRIFNFTMQIPPKYELLPNSFEELFEWLLYFREPYIFHTHEHRHRYFLPEKEGIMTDTFLAEYISQYLALHFLRLYTIDSINFIKETSELTIFKNKKPREKHALINNLEYFGKLIEKTITNKKVMSIITVDIDFHRWCKDNHKPEPIFLIDSLKLNQEKSIDHDHSNNNPDDEKVNDFFEKSKDILVNTLDILKVLKSSNNFIGNTKSWYLKGFRQVIQKQAFMDDEQQVTGYSGFDTFLAEGIKRNILLGLPEIFYLNKSKIYLLNPKDILDAMNKLNILSKQYFIVSFGINYHYLKYQNTDISIESAEKDEKIISETKDFKIINLNGYEIICFDSTSQLVGQSFFILNREDLPQIIFQEISEIDKKKYQLEPISEEIKLFASIIDLNKNHELREEIASKNKDLDYHKYVLACLELLIEFKWKESIEMIQIRVNNEYSQAGIPHNLNDVMPFRDEKNEK
jgi:hypothetical protein